MPGKQQGPERDEGEEIWPSRDHLDGRDVGVLLTMAFVSAPQAPREEEEERQT